MTATFGNTGNVLLSPSPATDQLVISLEKTSNNDADWQVYDLNGRLILSGMLPAETNTYPIGIAELPEGAYVFRLTLDQTVTVKQFRKNK